MMAIWEERLRWRRKIGYDVATVSRESQARKLCDGVLDVCNLGGRRYINLCL